MFAFMVKLLFSELQFVQQKQYTDGIFRTKDISRIRVINLIFILKIIKKSCNHISITGNLHIILKSLRLYFFFKDKKCCSI